MLYLISCKSENDVFYFQLIKKTYDHLLLSVIFIESLKAASVSKNKSVLNMFIPCGKFLRHGGARDLFCYTDEHVTCKTYSIV